MAPPTSSSLRQKYPHQIIPATSHLPTSHCSSCAAILSDSVVSLSHPPLLLCGLVCPKGMEYLTPCSPRNLSLLLLLLLLLLLGCCCCCLSWFWLVVACHDDAQKERIEQGQKQGKANLLPQLSLFFVPVRLLEQI